MPDQNALISALSGEDQAAMQPETFANPLVKKKIGDFVNLLSMPGKALQSEVPVTTQDMIEPARNMALQFGALGTPMAKSGSLGTFGGKPPAPVKIPITESGNSSNIDAVFAAIKAALMKEPSASKDAAYTAQTIKALDNHLSKPELTPAKSSVKVPFDKQAQYVQDQLKLDNAEQQGNYAAAMVPYRSGNVNALTNNYTTPAYRGMRVWNNEVSPVHGAEQGTYNEIYSSDSPRLADMYAGNTYKPPAWNPTGDHFGEGSSVAPLLLNTKDYHVYDAKGGVWQNNNTRAIKEAKALGKPGVVVKNVWDEPDSTKVLGEPKTVYITLPSGAPTVKSRFATKFDPTDPNMLHGAAGAAVGTGAAASMVDALNNDQNKKQ